MSKRVLVAEDDAAVRELYAFLLKHCGYEVIEAVDGKDAFDKFLKNPCELVITDMNMPRMNGMDLIEELRRHNPGVYIIMITAFGTSNTQKEALERGANEYVPKPFELDDLRSRVDGFFTRTTETS